MKILIITQWFDPEPTLKGLVFAKELKRQGHDVEVLTGFPNYPTGKIYDGYKLRLKQRESVEGIDVLRVALYPNHDSSAIKRIFNYISFAFMAMIFGVFSTKKADVIYAYHPPLTVGIAALLVGKIRRTPVVLDIQDMWPDTLKATGMMNNKKLLDVVYKVSQILYKYVDHIVVLSLGFKKLLMQRGVPAEKIDVIYNWCDEQALSNKSPIKAEYENLFKDKFNVVFAGNLGKAQGLDVIVDVAKKMQHHQRLQFIFVGDGTERESVINQTKQYSLGNIVFIPRVSMQEVGSILREADVLIVHLKDDPLFEITVPSKTQAYMAIGRPILMAVKGDAANIIDQANAGIIAQPENSESIIKGIENLYNLSADELSELGENGKKYYFQYMSLEEGCRNFIDVFSKKIK